jgi:CO/xanthine dehydrogenase FAD-binding subunit
MQMLSPSDLGETLAALAVHPHADLLAGGTDLMVEVNLRHHRPEAVIGLRHVAELRRLDHGYVGAMVTYQRLESSPQQALAELSRTIGSPQIRAAGTIGGNLGTASPAGDALPFLAAVDAQVELASAAGRRRLPWDEFLLGPKQTALRPGEVICGVVLPDPLPHRQAFAKIGQRQAMVIAAVNCCVVRDEEGATRVALGSVGPTVLRARRAEALVTGEAKLTPALLDEFQRLVSLEVRPITDHRSTAEYRRHAAGVLARRTLERCLQR